MHAQRPCNTWLRHWTHGSSIGREPVSAMIHVRYPGLHPSDLCDRCGMQAYVNVRMPSSRSLLWCEHHFTVHERDLRAAGGVVTADHRKSATAIPVKKLS
jgi:hypothetical protein